MRELIAQKTREQADLGLGQTLEEIPEETSNLSQTSSVEGSPSKRINSQPSTTDMLNAAGLPTARPVPVTTSGRQVLAVGQVGVFEIDV